MPYKLSNKADNDLKKIYKYTVKNFGRRQTEKYGYSWEECFLLLADMPILDRNCEHLKEGLCRHEHQNHTVFYRIRKDHIFIVRLLHEDMDPPSHL